jgi:catechol 2,3-dioxygenase-like lactoylglutathione lyase family enzyme
MLRNLAEIECAIPRVKDGQCRWSPCGCGRACPSHNVTRTWPECDETIFRLILAAVSIGCLLAAIAEDEKATTKTWKEKQMAKEHSGIVSVRYMIDDVEAAVVFYTKHLGFTLDVDSAPAFASIMRGNLRLLLSGEKSSGRKAMSDGTKPVPGGWNRILLEVTDINAEVARLRSAGVKFRRDDIVSGPGGSQIWVIDPSGNLVEIFQPNEWATYVPLPWTELLNREHLPFSIRFGGILALPEALLAAHSALLRLGRHFQDAPTAIEFETAAI